ncbi:hypothetical protein V6B16_02070 [Salinimicrobium catena]|uniref:hypothetical protein n=1 Tax=Salinimicrobium catena TaxID=390640 RepID=UPI002FE4CB4A
MMKKAVFLLGVSLISTGAFAQIDKSTTTVKAPGELSAPQTGEESSSLLNNQGNHSLSSKKGMFNMSTPRPLGEEEKKNFSMRTDNGLMKYQPENFKPKAFKDKEIKEEYRRDQYLGDLVTGGSIVELYCRDHEYVDGDKVRIWVNGEIIHNSVSLGAGFYPILVRLNMGFNNIEFEALNQGTSGPNTAELRVYDEKGAEVARKEWNLMTGGKANMVVVKQ